MENNKQLFTRLTVYIIVFVLVTISYINFTNSQEELKEEQSQAETLNFNSTKNIEATPNDEEVEKLEENGQVLGEIDVNDFTAEEEPVDTAEFSE